MTIDSLRFRITKRFGTKTVLRDFALEVRGKQFITFLGPSGCGKSTALNIIAGLIPATDGEVWIDGERIDHLPPEKRGFGMVFQNYALFPHMTVFANIAFGLQLQRRPAAEIRRARAGDAGPGPASRASRGATRDSSPAASSSGSPSPAPWSCTRASCSWTSRSRTSMPSCGSRCGPRSSGSTPTWASPPST